MGAVAVEIWTTNGGITMDNFVIGFDEDQAKAFAAKTWKVKSDAEKAGSQAKTREENRRAREVKRKQGGMMNMLEVYTGDLLDFVGENPVPAIGTLLALLLSLIYFTTRSGSDGEAPETTTSTRTEPREDDNRDDASGPAEDKDEDDGEKKSPEKPERKKKGKKRAD